MSDPQNLPAVPQTLEGWSVLHQMFRVRWAALQNEPHQRVDQIVSEATQALANLEREGNSAVYSLLGHKGDLLLIHYRNSFEDLNQIELTLARLGLSAYLEPSSSFLSVIELGLYDSSLKLYRDLQAKGLEAHSPEWQKEVETTLARQREAMRPRLYPKIPPTRYVCFYPMDRKRGEDRNFYTLPIEERQKQMEAHGLVGRRYAGKVQQVISGAIGFDNWEWGVDLYGDDPVAFKKLIYEMRFDEVSAVYALFGEFFVGIRVPAAKLGELLSGTLPAKSDAI